MPTYYCSKCNARPVRVIDTYCKACISNGMSIVSNKLLVRLQTDHEKEINVLTEHFENELKMQSNMFSSTMNKELSKYITISNELKEIRRDDNVTDSIIGIADKDVLQAFNHITDNIITASTIEIKTSLKRQAKDLIKDFDDDVKDNCLTLITKCSQLNKLERDIKKKSKRVSTISTKKPLRKLKISKK